MTVGLKNHTRCIVPVNEIKICGSALQIQKSKTKTLDDSSQVHRAPPTPWCPEYVADYAGSEARQGKKKHPLVFSRLSYIETPARR